MNRRLSKKLPQVCLVIGGAVAALAGIAIARQYKKVRRVRRQFRVRQLYIPRPPLPSTLLRMLLRTSQRTQRKPILPSEVRSCVRYISDGGDSVKVLLLERTDRPTGSPAFMWIHGGGMISGGAEADASFLGRLAHELNVLVISVEYRLAPEHPFPAPLDDCYIALKWLHNHAPTLGVDAARIAIGGSSAGGGLCAALAQRAHDVGEVAPAFQILIYPMLDDRTTMKTGHGGRGELLWRPTENLTAWIAYLGHRPTTEEDRRYAVPARRENLSGLPPAWIGVGTLDLFYEEDVCYAERLRAASVPCELDVVEGAYHGFDGVATGAPETVAFGNRMIEALRKALQ